MQVFISKDAVGWEPAGDIYNNKNRFYRPMRKGQTTKDFRVYTEIEKKALIEAQQFMKISDKDIKFFEFVDKEILQSIKDWCHNNSFNSFQITFCIVGNTYAIKEKLKDAGCQFHPTLGWHCAETLSLPATYDIIPITFDEAFEWNTSLKKPLPRESVKRLEAATPHSEYAGQIGDKIENKKCSLLTVSNSIGKYGLKYTYTFVTEDAEILVWQTSVVIKNATNDEYIIKKGKIKNLTEYHGEKRTIVKDLKFEE